MTRLEPKNPSERPRGGAFARIGLTLVASLAAGGCGQKGPLELPKPLPAAASSAQPGSAPGAVNATHTAPPSPSPR